MTLPRFLSLVLLATIAPLGASGGCGGTEVGTGGTGAGGGGSGGGATFDTCDAPGQCVLALNSCCGGCGMPELSSFAAINQAAASAFQKAVCPTPQPCPECGGQPNPNLFTYCDVDHCVAADARTHAVSECTETSDCVLRYGMGCCESTCNGVESELTCVSVKGFQAIHTALGCDSVACDACIPVYPMYAAPLCNNGHCEVGLLN